MKQHNGNFQDMHGMGCQGEQIQTYQSCSKGSSCLGRGIAPSLLSLPHVYLSWARPVTFWV